MKKLLVRLGISVLIGAGMLYLAAQRIDFSGVWEQLQRFSWSVVLPYLGFMTVQHLFRAWRWKFLLEPIHPVPFARILPVASVGFCAIQTLPLRMGELVRPYLIADPPRLRMTQGLGTMAVERVFDGLFLALVALVTVALARRRGPVPPLMSGSAFVALGVFVAALCILGLALWQKERAAELVRRLLARVAPGVADRAAEVVRGVVEGFLCLPDWRRLAAFLLTTLVYWMGNMLAMWVMARGFDMGLSIEGALALMALVGIGIMIPAGPAFIGNYHLFAEGALGMYLRPEVMHGPRSPVAGYIVLTHTLLTVWYVVTGLLALLSPHVNFTRVIEASTGDAPAAGEGAAAVAPAEKVDSPG